MRRALKFWTSAVNLVNKKKLSYPFIINLHAKENMSECDAAAAIFKCSYLESPNLTLNLIETAKLDPPMVIINPKNFFSYVANEI